MAVQISIPKGTRDFLPLAMQRRNYIFSILKDVFAIYGYQSIETPAMEDLSTLLGKYGEEGDKLLFKILNSGDFYAPIQKMIEEIINKNIIDKTELRNLNLSELLEQLVTERETYRLIASLTSFKIQNKIIEKGLRYDLTVPFARFVVMHRNEISFPFKRYQIQPVWRADRPQKGRYREFFQCDVDVVGSDSLLNEIELLRIIQEAFKRLDLNVTIILNNRKILQGMADYIGLPDRLTEVTVAIDKLDKIGMDGVVKELTEKDFPLESLQKLIPVLEFSSSKKTNEEVLAFANSIISDETGKKGIEEMSFILEYAKIAGITTDIKFDLSLARGLSYYTGTILEVKATDAEMGSICGGGRYDNLTGIFGMPGVSGVGMSFGADRIYDVMETLDKFPDELSISAKVLLVNFGHEEQKYCLKVLNEFYNAGISAELYPDTGAKMKKQMSYADNKKIPYVLIVGENEMSGGRLGLKNMMTGEQKQMLLSEIIDQLK